MELGWSMSQLKTTFSNFYGLSKFIGEPHLKASIETIRIYTFSGSGKLEKKLCCYKRSLVLLLFLLLLIVSGSVVVVIFHGPRLFCNSSTPRESAKKAFVLASADILQSLDLSVDPCQDFYSYSCNGWIEKHPIPKVHFLNFCPIFDRFLPYLVLGHFRSLLLVNLFYAYFTTILGFIILVIDGPKITRQFIRASRNLGRR